MTRRNRDVTHPNIFEVPADSEELVTLGYAIPVEKIKRLKDSGLPFLWTPLGAVRTFKCLEEEARTVMEPSGE